MRGGEWPWTPTRGTKDIVWGRIVDLTKTMNIRPSIRTLETLLNKQHTDRKVSRMTVARTLETHQNEWDRMFPEQP